MDTHDFVKKVTRISSEQAVTVKFNQQDSIVSLFRLSGLVERSDNLRFENELLVLAILSSNNWGGDRNRSIIVLGLSQGDEDMLFEIARDVESVTQPEHPAKVIASKREKSRLQAAEELRDAVLSVNVAEAEEWGLGLDFEVIDDDGFKVARFAIKHGDDEYASIGIDAWSGRLVVNGTLTDEQYINPKQLQGMLSESILEVADRVTAA